MAWSPCHETFQSPLRRREPKFVPYEPYKGRGHSPMGAPLEQRLQEAHQCTQDLQEQLRVQVEVNRELKKLLVASVGEDLEARVHFLSEDKAQLAADVRAYAQRLSQGREEIDRLAIHADVWRSKFLAASLLVDELANCKARLMRPVR
ncbi:hypothetical protein MRX96_005754 [Rhipicephalus microplus]